MEIRLGFSAVSRHCYFGVLGSEIKGGTHWLFFFNYMSMSNKNRLTREEKSLLLLFVLGTSLSLSSSRPR